MSLHRIYEKIDPCHFKPLVKVKIDEKYFSFEPDSKWKHINALMKSMIRNMLKVTTPQAVTKIFTNACVEISKKKQNY